MQKKSRISLIVLGFILSIAIWSVFIEPGLLKQNDQIIQWKGPKLRLAFFSDLHAGAPHITKEHIADLVMRINAQKPDLILIGGDLVINGVIGGKIMPIEELTEILKNLSAPHGVYVVRGNHDWWRDGDHIKEVLEKNKIKVLENESVHIDHDGKFKFWLVGIGDQFTEHADPVKAFAQVTSEGPRIVFMHDPAALFQTKEPFALALAGHMHGGQIFIPGIGALVTPGDAPKSWAQGWIEFPLGKVFVSRGIGTSILPVRFNAIPEYVIVELNSR